MIHVVTGNDALEARKGSCFSRIGYKVPSYAKPVAVSKEDPVFKKEKMWHATVMKPLLELLQRLTAIRMRSRWASS